MTNSELQGFAGCRRAWWLGTYRGLKMKAGESRHGAMALGTRVHLGLQAWYTPGTTQFDDTHALKAYSDSVDEAVHSSVYLDVETGELTPRDEEKIRAEAELGQIMLEGYFQHSRETGWDSELEILRVEQKTRVMFQESPRVDLLGKMDAEVRHRRTEANIYEDWKTCGSFDDIKSIAGISPQFRHYALLQFLRTRLEGGEGEWVDGGLYRMLRKVKRTATAKPPFYAELEVRTSLAELRSYWLHVAGSVERLVEAERQLEDGVDHRVVCPPSVGRHCRWCTFFPVCESLDNSDDAEGYIQEFYKVGDPLERYRDGEIPF